ncbi:hypothetical protein PUNSTDRAFT_54991, partial [Punctularia strigosozonata HHB-11173 SS5]
MVVDEVDAKPADASTGGSHLVKDTPTPPLETPNVQIAEVLETPNVQDDTQVPPVDVPMDDSAAPVAESGRRPDDVSSVLAQGHPERSSPSELVMDEPPAARAYTDPPEEAGEAALQDTQSDPGMDVDEVAIAVGEDSVSSLIDPSPLPHEGHEAVSGNEPSANRRPSLDHASYGREPVASEEALELSASPGTAQLPDFQASNSDHPEPTNVAPLDASTQVVPEPSLPSSPPV